MKPGRGLDILVGEKVFGFQKHPTLRAHWFDPENPGANWPMPNYSESIKSAWEVVEKLKESLGEDAFLIWYQNPLWTVAIDRFSHQELSANGWDRNS
jgi:hypothetical protein